MLPKNREDVNKNMEKLSNIYPQYTVNSSNNISSNNSKQYTVIDVSRFVDSLDSRVYVNTQYKPFYCKAAKILGFDRVHELEQMVIRDPRINDAHKFCPERVFFAALRGEMQRK